MVFMVWEFWVVPRQELHGMERRALFKRPSIQPYVSSFKIKYKDFKVDNGSMYFKEQLS